MDGSWDGKWHSPRQLLRFIARSTKRLAVLVVGLAVTGAGIAMLALPGPGIIVIIIGLAILATEFTWAEYLLDKAKEQAEKAKDKATKRFFRRGKGNAESTEPAPEPEPDCLDPENAGVVDELPR